MASKFFFGVKRRTIFQQNFAGKRWYKSYLDSDNIKILVDVIFRHKPPHSYFGIRPIERTLNVSLENIAPCEKGNINKNRMSTCYKDIILFSR